MPAWPWARPARGWASRDRRKRAADRGPEAVQGAQADEVRRGGVPEGGGRQGHRGRGRSAAGHQRPGQGRFGQRGRAGHPAGHGLRRGGHGGRPAVRVRAGRAGRQADRRPAVVPLPVQAEAQGPRPAPAAPGLPAPAAPGASASAPAAARAPAGGQLHRHAARARHPAAHAGRAGHRVPRGRRARPRGSRPPSDAGGRFRFFDLAPGDWKVLVEAPGYYPFRTTETMAPARAGGRHLLRRAGLVQPLRRHGDRHPAAQGGQPHRAERQGDRQGPGHRRRSAGGHPELRRRGPRAVRRADHRARFGPRGHRRCSSTARRCR